VLNQSFRGVDTNSFDSPGSQHAAEASFATADVQGTAEAFIAEALNHWSIEHKLAPKVALFADIGNPT
jgi:hypothetical protein